MRAPQVVVPLVLLLAACGSSTPRAPTPPPQAAALLVRQDAEGPGANCPAGGVAVRAGLDANGNGVLDDAEVAKTSFACGAVPAPVVTRSAAEAPGSNCALGGTRVDAGRDANGNHVLDDAEVLDTAFVCSVAPAPPPAVLSVVVTEFPDATCPFGGSEIRSGPDLDGNGTLDAGEISVVRHVCETQALPGFTIASDADLQLFDRASVVKGDVTVQSSTLDFVS